MSVLQIVALIFVGLSWAIPIYGIVKKIRFKTPIVLASIFVTGLSALLVIASSGMAAEDFKNMELAQTNYPILDAFYRYSYLVWVISLGLNLYYIIKKIED